MSERRTSSSAIKRLFALSGGRCAFPGCHTDLMPDSGGTIAEVAHIEAHSLAGRVSIPLKSPKIGKVSTISFSFAPAIMH